MNLAEYEKMDTSTGGGEFIGFEKTGDTKYLRFLYESGGESMGADVEFRRKKWDEANHQFVYDTEDGQLYCSLKAIEYDEDGSNPRLVKWDRSAYFCKTVLLPLWKNYPRIIDGVWKVTASNPKTTDATYTLFPVLNADTIKYPIIKEDQNQQQQNKSEKEEKPVEQKPKTKKKYWE